MSKPPKPKKIRNHIANEGVAANREELYRRAIRRYNTAMEQGFYFEAIAIMESIIADRMESRIGELTQEPVPFNTLGNLRDRLNGKKDEFPRIETNEDLSKLYNKVVSVWAGKRNAALHQIVKISMEEPKDWTEFLTDAKEAAKEGRKIFQELNNLLQKDRR